MASHTTGWTDKMNGRNKLYRIKESILSFFKELMRLGKQLILIVIRYLAYICMHVHNIFACTFVS